MASSFGTTPLELLDRVVCNDAMQRLFNLHDDQQVDTVRMFLESDESMWPGLQQFIRDADAVKVCVSIPHSAHMPLVLKA